MAQGLGISILLRAYQISGEKEYINSAKESFKIIKTSIEEGGVSYHNNIGIWYEEYPNLNSPSHVLNGHIWTLFGLWDLFRVTNDEEAKDMFFKGIDVLKKDLPKYDTGFWIVYDQKFNSLVNRSYIEFIVDQLKVLHTITNDNIFIYYSKKWGKYKDDKKNILKIYIYNKTKSIKNLFKTVRT